MKVKSESEVTQSCPTLSDPMDCSLLGSSVHGIFQARVLEWGAIAFSQLPDKSSFISLSLIHFWERESIRASPGETLLSWLCLESLEKPAYCKEFLLLLWDFSGRSSWPETTPFPGCMSCLNCQGAFVKCEVEFKRVRSGIRRTGFQYSCRTKGSILDWITPRSYDNELGKGKWDLKDPFTPPDGRFSVCCSESPTGS